MINFTKIPNKILDSIGDMSESELKLTMCIVRYTFGYHQDKTRMTYDIMQERTGLSRGAIYRAIELVENRGFFSWGRRSYWSVNRSEFELFLTNSNDENMGNSSNSEPYQAGNSSNSEPYQAGNSSNSEPTKRKEIKEKEREEEDPTLNHWLNSCKLVDWWCDLTGQKRINHHSLNGRREETIKDYHAPATLLLNRLGENNNSWRELVGQKRNEMLRAKLRPRRLDPVVSQIISDLDAASLSQQQHVETAASSAPLYVANEEGLY